MTNENPEAATSWIFYSYFCQWEGLNPQAGCQLLVTVQASADEMANHTCHNSNSKRNNNILNYLLFFLSNHLQIQCATKSPARMTKNNTTYFTDFTSFLPLAELYHIQHSQKQIFNFLNYLTLQKPHAIIQPLNRNLFIRKT